MAAESGSGREDGRQSDLAVMGADEFKNKFRLERILQSIDNIETQANKAWEQFVHKEISHDAKNIIIQRAVKRAVRESYNLLLDHNQAAIKAAIEAGEEPKGSKYWIGRGDDPIGVIKQVSRENIGIFGLRDFLGTEEFYTETWTEIEDVRHGKPGQARKSRKESVPERVSWNAALRLKKFLNDVHDLEVQFEELDDSRPYNDWREEFESGVYRSPDDVDLPHKDV